MKNLKNNKKLIRNLMIRKKKLCQKEYKKMLNTKANQTQQHTKKKFWKTENKKLLKVEKNTNQNRVFPGIKTNGRKWIKNIEMNGALIYKKLIRKKRI